MCGQRGARILQHAGTAPRSTGGGLWVRNPIPGDVSPASSPRADSTTAQVENLLDAVGGVRELQLELRPFPIGIPWPDGLGVEVLIPRDRFDVLKDLLAVPGLQGIEIFPLGIVNPEVFRAVLSIR